jgi:hypothetical protein
VIFRRRPAAAGPDTPDETLEDYDFEDTDDGDDDLDYDEDEGDEDGARPAEPVDEWEALDLSRDWREDGPFDIEEVDFDADDVARVDLGALIVTPEPGLKIQLVVDQKTKSADTLIVAGDQAVLQVTVLAAPGAQGFTAEWRERLTEETLHGGGSVTPVAGPFGTELRRVVVATDAEGKTTKTPVRDWLVQGPRWLLHARLLGGAARDITGSGPAAELEEFFRNLIVRRGDTALVPGSPVPLRPPETR